ncbi:interferon-related developmental regulator-domain-containing protein [Daldinia caldariorum]|uniref:interferon-related developmental regulator-domain-containing protein n=1 Tax=Daldinia caldariorum TaxID=326644 RepID=UPI0020075594|nr:interferon-related developmental regulator-domain-containing protein [Daldinia caldariorum]KAI1466147.1 interferon-related developmental regulator-domain-containing protein [Daldinia caldariorum]
MHDLRKKIFESGKTVSRKARSRQQSAQASPAGSRAASRAASRQASEEEDSSDYEYNESIASSVINSEDGDESGLVPPAEILHSRIVDLLDQKRDGAQDREDKLTAYTELIRHHPSAEEIDGQMNELIPLLLKTIRGRRTPQGVLWALRALMLTILTTGDESIHDRVYPTLKSLSQDTNYDDDDELIKVATIKAMGISTMCGGGSETAAEEFLEFLIEIIESDGHIVEAGDNGPVVAAALKTWGFVASGLDDLEDQSTQALEAFTEQLESSDVDVQVAAGSNIALLMEAAREYEEENGETWNLRFDQDGLLRRLNALTRESSKAISKRDRRQLHSSFNSIVTSLEHGKGPGYSTARRFSSNPHTGGNRTDFNEDYQEYGYRQRFRIQNISITIDSWSLSARLEMLKSILGGGLASHYINNPVVKDLLSGAKTEYVSSPPRDKLSTSKLASKSGHGKKAVKSVSD